MPFDKSKKEIVYHTTDQRDSTIIKIANQCKKNNTRFVLLIPTIKKYTYEINEGFSILGDDFLIYEISMGLGVVLKSRAEKYIKYIPNSELYE